jgi:hypothetical protein
VGNVLPTPVSSSGQGAYMPQLMSLPPSMLTRLDLSQPLAIKMNNAKVVIPPSCIIKSQEGVKVKFLHCFHMPFHCKMLFYPD